MNYTNLARNGIHLSKITITQNEDGALKDRAPDMVVILSGEKAKLRTAETQLRDALLAKNLVENETSPIPTANYHYTDNGKLDLKNGTLTIAFSDLESRTPEEMLGQIHKATNCDLNAYICKDITSSKTIRPEDTEDTITHVPCANITINNNDGTTREIVGNYLRQTLHRYFSLKHPIGNVGKLGLPLEYLGERLINPEFPADNKIFLTFMGEEQVKYKKSDAEQLANIAAEHLSGVLGISERLNEPLQSAGNTSTHRRR